MIGSTSEAMIENTTKSLHVCTGIWKAWVATRNDTCLNTAMAKLEWTPLYFTIYYQ